MSSRKSVPIAVMSFLILSSLYFLQCSGSDNYEPIKIGLITAITDKNNPDYQSDKEERIQAAQLAVDEINEGGGIYGRKLELIVEDSRNDNLFAAQRSRELIKMGVAAIIGPSTSSQLQYVADSVTTKNHMVLISPSATAADITSISSDTNNTVWRTCPSDVFQAGVAAKYISQDLKKNSMAILYVKNAYGSSLSDNLKRRLTAMKGKNVSMVSYPPEAEDNMKYDFSSYMPQVFKGKPELVYVISASEASKILGDMNSYVASKNLAKPVIMGCDGNYDQRVLRNTDKSFIDGMIGTAPATSANDPNFKKFAENYKNKYNKPVTSAWGAGTYDAVYCIAYAMLKSGYEKTQQAKPGELSRMISQNLVDVSQAGTPVGVNDFAKGRDILQNGGQIDYEGASGDIDFDKNGDVTGGTYLFWKVNNGRYSEIRTERYP